MINLNTAAPPEKQIDLNFDNLICLYRNKFSLLPETRIGLNTKYPLSDAAAGAFSVFFMQHPSFLSHQQLLEKKYNQSNAKTLFQMQEIPCDNQIRNMLDPLSPSLLSPLYNQLASNLYHQGYLEPYRAINNTLLIAFDGTQSISSKKLHCDNCYVQNHRNGTTTYSHKIVTPVIVTPGNSRVVSLAPEFITPQDGHAKQDSEHAAAKRWLDSHAEQCDEFGGVTFLGDDLYSHQPQCEAVLAKGQHFIFTCKESSHKTLYEWVNELDALGNLTTVIEQRKHGKERLVDTYRIINQVPIKDGDDALLVNWCEITTINKNGDIIYHSAFISDHEITKKNAHLIVSNARARWHIENGNNNTLKTKGYHLTHNFGHGKKNLASFLLSLNLLAFLFHTILAFHDKRYQAVRNGLPTRKHFFQALQTLTTFMVFSGWMELMEFMMDGLEVRIDDG